MPQKCDLPTDAAVSRRAISEWLFLSLSTLRNVSWNRWASNLDGSEQSLASGSSEGALFRRP